jgi:hypothetical protein
MSNPLPIAEISLGSKQQLFYNNQKGLFFFTSLYVDKHNEMMSGRESLYVKKPFPARENWHGEIYLDQK